MSRSRAENRFSGAARCFTTARVELNAALGQDDRSRLRDCSVGGTAQGFGSRYLASPIESDLRTADRARRLWVRQHQHYTGGTLSWSRRWTTLPICCISLIDYFSVPPYLAGDGPAQIGVVSLIAVEQLQVVMYLTMIGAATCGCLCPGDFRAWTADRSGRSARWTRGSAFRVVDSCVTGHSDAGAAVLAGHAWRSRTAATRRRSRGCVGSSNGSISQSTYSSSPITVVVGVHDVVVSNPSTSCCRGWRSASAMNRRQHRSAPVAVLPSGRSVEASRADAVVTRLSISRVTCRAV